MNITTDILKVYVDDKINEFEEKKDALIKITLYIDKEKKQKKEFTYKRINGKIDKSVLAELEKIMKIDNVYEIQKDEFEK